MTIDAICDDARRRQRFVASQKVRILIAMRRCVQDGLIADDTPTEQAVEIVQREFTGTNPQAVNHPEWDWQAFAAFVIKWLPIILAIWL